MDHDIDRYKSIVDDIFESLIQNANKAEVDQNLSDSEECTSSYEEFAKEKALAELEEVRLAFLAFQDKVRHLTLFNYMTSSFEQFAEYASNFGEVIEDNIDEDKLTPDSLKKYQRIKRLRAQILNSIYKKYKKDKGGN